MPVWVAMPSCSARLFARSGDRFHVALEHSFERLRGLPFRVFRNELFDTREYEGKLDIHRLLNPESAIVIEGGYAIVDRNKIWGAIFCNLIHEGDD